MHPKNDLHEDRLKIPTISCASCVRTIENALRAVPEVASVDINFATKTAIVLGKAPLHTLISAVEGVGYKAQPIQTEQDEIQNEDEEEHYYLLLRQAGVAGFIGILLMILGFFPLIPEIISFRGQMSWIGIGVISLFVLIYSASDIYIAAWKSFKAHIANMDTLIAIGTGVAWLFSMLITLFPALLPDGGHAVYFESALIIIAFIKFGSALEIRTRGKTKEAIQKLIDLSPKMARVVKDG